MSSKSEYVCFTYDATKQLYQFDDADKVKSIQVADGFINLKFPEEKVVDYGVLDNNITEFLHKTANYAPLKNFKEEKIEIWVLDSMMDGPEGTQQQAENFRIEEYAIKDKFDKSKSLSMYREN